MKTILEIKNLKKIIKNHEIIKNISFSINEGEILGLIGPNGAGKSTILKMLTGILHPSSGEILINGINFNSNFEKAMNFIGGIVENPRFYNHLTGLKNLKIYSRMYQNIDNNRILDVMKLVGLESTIETRVKNYSLGMRQRLGIAQSLLNNPKLLVLDEPTNGLDCSGIMDLKNLLKLLSQEGTAIIISSHLLSEIEVICDKVAIINNGTLIKVNHITKETNSMHTYIPYLIDTSNNLLTLDFIKNNLDSSAIFQNFIFFKCSRDSIILLNIYLRKNKIIIFHLSPYKGALEKEFLSLIQ